jgi:hypothetical protein
MMSHDPLEIMHVLAAIGVLTRSGLGEALLFASADGRLWGAVVGPQEQDLGVRLLLSQRETP